eukprot:SM000009S23535  [mRNA]  locus=s9:573713:574162:- [translate_table: standard]
MEVAKEHLEVVERGTQEVVVEGEVVEVGGLPEDCEGEGRRMEVMALLEAGVEGCRDLEVVEDLEVVVKGMLEEVVEAEVGRTVKVMEVAAEDYEVEERGTQEEVKEEVGGQLEDCDEEGRRMEVIEVGLAGFEDSEVVEVVEEEVEGGP